MAQGSPLTYGVVASALNGWRASPSVRGLGEIVVACASTEFKILGPLQVFHDGEPIMLDSPKQRALLAVLLIRANQVVSTDSLLDALWGEDLPSAGLKTLRYHVSRLRAALREASEDAAAMVITQAPGYLLDVDPAQTDAGRFEAGVSSARRVLDLAPPEAATLLVDALAEWSGSALADFAFDEFAQVEIRRLDELRLASVTDRIGAELACGAGGELVAELESLVALHPRHERLWAHLMLALHRSGRTSDAVEAYQRARAELSEAGMVPSDDLVTMESRILADDPALRPPASRPTSGLPSPLTDLIGRGIELTEVRAAMAERRLVTLVGPGGVGKTSVALEAAHQLAEAEYSVAWVELASVTDPTRITRQLATALGVGDQAGRDLLDTLRTHLRSGPTILVVDNCEHVLDGAAELIADLLSSCPELRVLATSRETLRVAGEKVLPTQPLPVPDDAASLDDGAVALFEARARDVDPSYVASAADRDTIAGICRTLDGLPLAIELAAARMQVMGPEQLAARLDDRFRALSSHTRGGPKRHSSLEATMRWSYDQLNNNEQLLLDRLSVFADRFSLDAVERVCGFGEIQPDDVVDLLGELVAKSLVTRRPTSKLAAFALLETIRAWATASVDKRDHGHKLADQHAQYCTQAAAALPPTPDGLIGFKAIQAELDKAMNHLVGTESFEAAAALMTASFSNWTHIGGVRDAYRWFVLLLPNIDQLTPRARAPVLLGAGTATLLSPNADLERSGDLYRAAISEFGTAGLCAHTPYNNLGQVCLSRGMYEEAAELYRQAIQEIITHSCPDNGGLPRVPRSSLGVALIDLGRLDEARAELELCAIEATSAGWGATGAADIGLAELLRREGKLSSARDLLLERAAIIESSDLRDSHHAAWVNADLGRIELALGLTDEARGHVTRSLEAYSRIISIDEVCDGLAVAAAVAEADAAWHTAAFILGGLASWTMTRGLVLRADSMELVDRTAAQQRSALTAQEFEAAWNAGTGTSVADMSDHFIASVSTSEG